MALFLELATFFVLTFFPFVAALLVFELEFLPTTAVCSLKFEPFPAVTLCPFEFVLNGLYLIMILGIKLINFLENFLLFVV